MSTITISTSLTTDADQYLRRRCPACWVEFKIHEDLRQSARYCPSCGHVGDVGEWHSDAQKRHIQAVAAHHGQRLVQDELKKMAGRFNRSGGPLRMTTTPRPLGPEPRCPPDFNDMTARALSCCGRHIKLNSGHGDPICPWCGPRGLCHTDSPAAE